MRFYRHRFWFIVALIAVIGTIILGRIFLLDSRDGRFLVGKAKHESIHYKSHLAQRGLIYDRNGIPLAVSTHLETVIFDPKVLNEHPEVWQKLADDPVLNLSYYRVKYLITHSPNSRYQIAKKGTPPELAERLRKRRIPGVHTEAQPISYYPIGNSAAQIIGFTNVQNQGQDGLELSYNQVLAGHPGKSEVLEDAIGEILAINKTYSQLKDGKDLTLSIDSRIQYIAYQTLANQVQKVHATSGSIAVLDPNTGEVLAAASYPGFNPNTAKDRSGKGVRDRAITDTYEPGSTVKVVTLAAALESGKYTPNTPIDTRPGYYYIGKYRIRDDANFGQLDLTSVLMKSSNVGISKIALSLPRQDVYDMFLKFGVGSNPGGNFPGEASGIIHPLSRLGKFEFATMTFGYAITMSTLQLARMYATIASGGVIYPVSFVKTDAPNPGKRIISEKVSSQLIEMLKTVMSMKGTGLLGNIPGYHTAGKTGTAHKVGPHGFYHNRFNAIFVGMVPVPNPKLVIAVRINDPKGHYNGFGGVSAAPVFAKVAEASLHILGVPPNTKTINRSLFRNQKRFIRMISEA